MASAMTVQPRKSVRSPPGLDHEKLPSSSCQRPVLGGSTKSVTRAPYTSSSPRLRSRVASMLPPLEPSSTARGRKTRTTTAAIASAQPPDPGPHSAQPGGPGRAGDHQDGDHHRPHQAVVGVGHPAQGEAAGQGGGPAPARPLDPPQPGQEHDGEALEVGERLVRAGADLLVGEDHEDRPGPDRRGVAQAQPAHEQVHGRAREGQAAQHHDVVGHDARRQLRGDPGRQERHEQRGVDGPGELAAERRADHLLHPGAPEPRPEPGGVPVVPHVARLVAARAAAGDDAVGVDQHRPGEHDGQAEEAQQHAVGLDRRPRDQRRAHLAQRARRPVRAHRGPGRAHAGRPPSPGGRATRSSGSSAAVRVGTRAGSSIRLSSTSPQPGTAGRSAQSARWCCWGRTHTV